MGAGKYFRKEFQLSMFSLNHYDASDFYLSSWQRNRSVVPLLCVRGFLFIGCLTILLSAIILTGMSSASMSIGHWFIYLTDWGIIFITVASGLSFLVSLNAYRHPRDFSLDLTWDVKCFWAAYNIATTLAYFITIYYYGLLAAMYADMEFSINATLDVFIHGVNSILMFVLMMTSRVPGRLLHFVYPVGAAIVYLFFSLIYHFAGGRDPFGNEFIYPTLDWNNPGLTAVSVIVTAIFIVVVHWLAVGLSALRDCLTRQYRRDTANFSVSNIPPEYS